MGRGSRRRAALPRICTAAPPRPTLPRTLKLLLPALAHSRRVLLRLERRKLVAPHRRPLLPLPLSVVLLGPCRRCRWHLLDLRRAGGRVGHRRGTAAHALRRPQFQPPRAPRGADTTHGSCLLHCHPPSPSPYLVVFQDQLSTAHLGHKLEELGGAHLGVGGGCGARQQGAGRQAACVSVGVPPSSQPWAARHAAPRPQRPPPALQHPIPPHLPACRPACGSAPAHPPLPAAAARCPPPRWSGIR